MAYWVYKCHLSYMPEIANGFSQTDWNCHARPCCHFAPENVAKKMVMRKKALSNKVNVKHKVQW